MTNTITTPVKPMVMVAMTMDDVTPFITFNPFMNNDLSLNEQTKIYDEYFPQLVALYNEMQNSENNRELIGYELSHSKNVKNFVEICFKYRDKTNGAIITFDGDSINRAFRCFLYHMKNEPQQNTQPTEYEMFLENELLIDEPMKNDGVNYYAQSIDVDNKIIDVCTYVDGMENKQKMSFDEFEKMFNVNLDMDKYYAEQSKIEMVLYEKLNPKNRNNVRKLIANLFTKTVFIDDKKYGLLRYKFDYEINGDNVTATIK